MTLDFRVVVIGGRLLAIFDSVERRRGLIHSEMATSPGQANRRTNWTERHSMGFCRIRRPTACYQQARPVKIGKLPRQWVRYSDFCVASLGRITPKPPMCNGPKGGRLAYADRRPSAGPEPTDIVRYRTGGARHTTGSPVRGL